jgi:hypothetical protein
MEMWVTQWLWFISRNCLGFTFEELCKSDRSWLVFTLWSCSRNGDTHGTKKALAEPFVCSVVRSSLVWNNYMCIYSLLP